MPTRAVPRGWLVEVRYFSGSADLEAVVEALVVATGCE
jgi:hypothetical protein